MEFLHVFAERLTEVSVNIIGVFSFSLLINQLTSTSHHLTHKTSEVTDGDGGNDELMGVLCAQPKIQGSKRGAAQVLKGSTPREGRAGLTSEKHQTGFVKI